MKVRELIEKLNQVDQDAQVYLRVEEQANRAYTVVRNGDALYFEADPAHTPGESHIYIDDRPARWQPEAAQAI